MWLAFDVGNSAFKGAFFEGAQIVHPVRFPVEDAESPERLAKVLLLAIEGRPVLRAGCVSVVPALGDALSAALERVTGIRMTHFDASSRIPFEIEYSTPQTLGADRLAAAVAAHRIYGGSDMGGRRPVIAVDAGTAVTYELLTGDGRYLGGPIAPGPGLIRSALNRGTAQLPAVELTMPEDPVGGSTREAIRSGVMFGFLDSVERMLTRLSETFSTRPFVVATGGWAAWLDDRLASIDTVDPDLVLKGVREMMTLCEDQPEIQHPGAS